MCFVLDLEVDKYLVSLVVLSEMWFLEIMGRILGVLTCSGEKGVFGRCF